MKQRDVMPIKAEHLKKNALTHVRACATMPHMTGTGTGKLNKDKGLDGAK